ncbi:MAG: DEAD/DEAH box helicase, partial [Clostridia bacterium]|nr:DEAD/DEAH box helicase [Clostridia bacterium]
LIDVFSKDTIVCFDESKFLYDNLEYLEKEHINRCESLFRGGNGLDFIKNQFISKQKLISELTKFNAFAMQAFKTIIPFFTPLKTYSLSTSPLGKYALKPDELKVDLLGWQLKGYRVILCCGDLKYAEKTYYFLKENKISSLFKDELPKDFNGILVTTYELDSGFIYHDSKLAVIGTNDLFFKTKSKEKSIKKKRGDMFSAPTVGDFAVHENFGVGIVRGVKRIATIEGSKDYIEVEYYGGDRLYVSTDQMDKLSKYVAGDKIPTLNKIGGGEFERIKERVRQSISKMTINLKKLYKERKEKKGFVFSKNEVFMQEFGDAFEFDLTEDQSVSLEEIFSDMESDKVMDRLLCGDVGFGKTELAFRACFKAILDGKQTALIAPTTILTEQHYMTAKKRFKDFGVRIEVLNRFRSKTKQEKIIKD